MPTSWNESFLLYWNATAVLIEKSKILGTSWSNTWEQSVAVLVDLAAINTTSNQMVALGNKIVSLLKSGVNQTEQLYLQQLWNSTMSAFNATAMTSVTAASVQYRALYNASDMLYYGGILTDKNANRCLSYNESIDSQSSQLATLQQSLSLCGDNVTCEEYYGNLINTTTHLLELESENFGRSLPDSTPLGYLCCIILACSHLSYNGSPCFLHCSCSSTPRVWMCSRRPCIDWHMFFIFKNTLQEKQLCYACT